jgi:prevent-host-death family protein
VAQVNVHDAKTHLSRLLERAERGEEIVIARAGKPVARLVPLAPEPSERRPGYLKGRIVIHPSFYEPDPELERLFYESRIFPREEE